METVGFIGLGNMGGPVAGHIQGAGYPMIVYDLRDEATRSFRERGANVAESAAELARKSDVIITALPMPADVEQVARGANGIIEGIRLGSVYVDISTSPPSLVRGLEPLFRAKGASVLDAPVASGQPGAARGIHEVMVGGEREIFERVKPILTAFGDQVLYAGPLGSGSICKLVHQMIGCSVSQAIAEGLSLGVKAGVEPKVLWDCVRRGMVGRMHVLHYQVPQTVFRGTFETQTFPLKLLRKDVRLATDLGRELNVPLSVANIAEQILVEAINRGWGDKAAYTVTFLLQEEAAHVRIRATDVDPDKSAKYISTHPNAE
ncbi:MAG TPA: NAD(P)-dependent oxidoreductase [Candidatus Binatia bacterium]|nr:NAD(P)-dependent oxidoreductase [Candidatus Binatia bacterium]